MASYVQHPRSTVTGAMPPGTLPIGVIAVNFPDKRLTTIATGSVVVNLGRRIEPHNAALAYKQYDIIIDASGGLRSCLADIAPKAFLASDWTATSSVANAIVPSPPAGTSQRITSAAIADVPLSLRGFVGQTGNLQQWENSAGAVLASISALGALTVVSLNGVAPAEFARLPIANVFTQPQTIQSATGAKFVLRGAGAGNANVAWHEIQDSGSVRQMYFGKETGTNGTIALVNEIADGQLNLRATGAASVVAIVGGSITLNGVNSVDFGRLSQANTWAATQTFSGAQPVTRWIETDAGTDLKTWDIFVNGGVFNFRAVNDALGAATNWLTVTRTLAVPQAVTLAGAASVNLTSGVNSLQVQPIAVTLLGTNTDAVLSLSTGGGGTAGDCVLRWNNSGLQAWAAGIDRSLGTSLVFTPAATIDGAAPVVAITPTGAFNVTGKASINAGALPNPLDLNSALGAYINFFKGGVAFAASGSAEALGGAALAYAVYVGGAIRFQVSNTGNFNFFGGTAVSSNVNAAEVGYKGAPQNEQGGSYSAVLDDAGKSIKMTGAGTTLTIPALAYPPGTVMIVYNRSGGNITVAAPSLVLGDGTNTPGSRLVGNNSFASLYHSGGGEWIISGSAVA